MSFRFFKMFLSVITLFAMFLLVSCDSSKPENVQIIPSNEITFTSEYVADTETTYFDNNKIDVNKVISSVKFLNFNGYGFVKIYHSACSLTEDIPSETMKNFVSSVAPELAFQKYGKGYAYYFEDIVRFVPEYNYNRLSNGDIVNLVATVTDEFSAYGVTLDMVKQGLGIDFDSVVSYTVSGLINGFNPTDVMTGIEQYVVFENIDGKISGRIELPSNYAFDVNGFHIYAVDSDSMIIKISETEQLQFKYKIEGDSFKPGDSAIVKLKLYTWGGTPTDEDLIGSFAAKGGFFTDLYKEITVPNI